MKKFSRTIVRVLNILYKIFPLFAGMYCYYPAFLTQENRVYPFWDALYASIKLYSGSTEGGIPVGILLQCARFLAIAATLSIVVGLMNKMNDVVNHFKLLRGETTVVYGDSEYANYLFESLNPGTRIRGGETFVDRASRYVLMFSGDRENLVFYNRHYEELKDKDVYIMLEGISRQNIENPHIIVFSIAESCARQYWKDFPPAGSERIALFGFGDLGKNILLCGLQMNLIDPGQHFEYHIYGDGAEFRREHTELSQMAPDEIIFHDGGNYDMAQMAEFDRIILCGSGDETQNITAASKLLMGAAVRCPIYIYAPNGDVVKNFFGDDRLICFGTTEETARAEQIFNQRSMEAARRQHEFYCRQYGGTPWEKLDCFKRYSNVSSSDYMYTIRRLLDQGVPMETVAELEHIRWCRYHYLHNWKYAPETDSGKRLHNCLMPFSQLSGEEQRKDVEAITSKMKEDGERVDP